MKLIDELTRHDHVDMGSRNECEMCNILQINNAENARQSGKDTINRGKFQLTKTNWGCRQCNIWLCKVSKTGKKNSKTCFEALHRAKNLV